MKRLLILAALGVTAYKLTRRQPVEEPTPPVVKHKASRGRRLALATLACVLVSAAAYGAYITLIDGSGTATAPLGADATTNTITLHFTIPAGLTPGQSAPLTGPGPNGGITADVQGGGTALIQGIKLGSITTSDPTHCLPAWFTVTGLPVDANVNGAFPKLVSGSNYEVLPPQQGVNGSLPVLTFVDDGTTDQDTCRIGTGTSANPVPDTVTVTLVPW
jgi:hypothetical protein